MTHTTRKMIVKPASRMLSAISLGVFCRLAPSTRLIMRSRKPSPGLARDAHDQPVGEHARAAGDRAAVAARLRGSPGALSPVTALSSTEAMPSITSPSAGMMSPASTRNTSSLRASAWRTIAGCT